MRNFHLPTFSISQAAQHLQSQTAIDSEHKSPDKSNKPPVP